MPLRILIGGAACGKTRAALNYIQNELSTPDIKKLWVLLPDRRQINWFREKLVMSGSMVGVSLGNFYEFSHDILLKSDQYYVKAPEPILHRIVLDLVNKLSQSGELGEFENIKEKPGFLQILHQKFSELSQAGYTKGSNDLQESQVEGILNLFEVYRKRLEHLQWIDEHQIDSLALATVITSPDLIKGLDGVIVDGFERFTSPQVVLLCLLANLGVNVLVTLPGNDAAGRTIYQRSEKSLEQFKRGYPELDLDFLDVQPFLSASILGLANNYFVDEPQKIEKHSNVRLLAAYSPLQEVRESLRYIKKFIYHDKYYAGDCAILIPDEVQYSPLLQTVADEFHVPIHFGWGIPLDDVPQLKLITDLLKVRQDDFPRRLFLDVIRSPFIDLTCFGFRPSDASVLERVSRYGPVVGGLEQWIKILKRLSTQLGDAPNQSAAEDEDNDIFNLPNPETCERLIISIQKFSDAILPPEGQNRITVWVEWLWKLLHTLGWMRFQGSNAEKPWFEKFRQDLREMCISDLELGSWNLNFHQFVNELEMDLKINCYQEKMDPKKVQILRIGDARGLRFEHVVILGLAEGVFPKAQREDPFLPESFRLQAGLESHVDLNPSGVFYQAMTRANTNLMVTRPYLSDKGESLEPSPYWNALTACLEEDDIEFIRSTTKRKLKDAATLEEMLFWSNRFRISLTWEDEHLQPMMDNLNHQKAVFSDRQSKQTTGIYEGEIKELTAGLTKNDQVETHWSVSRLETYKSCPMRFWTQYALAVKEQRIPVLGLESFQIGSVLHQILEEVYMAVEDPSSVEQLLELLPVEAQRVFNEAPEKYQFEPTVYWQTQQDEWLSILKAAITGLATDEWIPLAFEQKFGLDGNPALKIDLEEGRCIRLHGVIDRIDRDNEGNLRVIDYKTGVSHLTKKDLVEGTRLQLPLYALAATQALQMGNVREGLYWSLNGKEAGSLKLSEFRIEGFNGPDGAIQVAKLHLQMIMEGLSQADFRPHVPDGGCPNYCAARLWCWHYRAGR